MMWYGKCTGSMKSFVLHAITINWDMLSIL